MPRKSALESRGLQFMYNNFTRPERYYAESEGDTTNRVFYVVDRYADPASDKRTIPCANMLQAYKKALQLNSGWPDLPWDTLQAQRDGYFPETPQ